MSLDDNYKAMMFRMALGGENGKRLFLRMWLNIAYSMADGQSERQRVLEQNMLPNWKPEDREFMQGLLKYIKEAMDCGDDGKPTQ